MIDDEFLLARVVSILGLLFAGFCFVSAVHTAEECGWDYAVSHWRPCEAARR